MKHEQGEINEATAHNTAVSAVVKSFIDYAGNFVNKPDWIAASGSNRVVIEIHNLRYTQTIVHEELSDQTCDLCTGVT